MKGVQDKKSKIIINGAIILFLLLSMFQTPPKENTALAQGTNFSVYGRVTDGLGRGLAGVTVFADPKYKIFLPFLAVAESSASTNSTDTADIQFYYSAITDADGYYTIPNIPSGSYYLQVGDMPGVTF